mmetsp:Transcript_73318/g.203404  ORF Transcript_73318/g.203404 Transcript_73318/m.203404 type:complete len:289 (+) Transcript_73318:195-1061(+)
MHTLQTIQVARSSACGHEILCPHCVGLFGSLRPPRLNARPHVLGVLCCGGHVPKPHFEVPASFFVQPPRRCLSWNVGRNHLRHVFSFDYKEGGVTIFLARNVRVVFKAWQDGSQCRYPEEVTLGEFAVYKIMASENPTDPHLWPPSVNVCDDPGKVVPSIQVHKIELAVLDAGCSPSALRLDDLGTTGTERVSESRFAMHTMLLPDACTVHVRDVHVKQADSRALVLRTPLVDQEEALTCPAIEETARVDASLDADLHGKANKPQTIQQCREVGSRLRKGLSYATCPA